MRLSRLVPIVLAVCLSAPLHAPHAQQSDSARTHRDAVRRLMEVTNVRQMVEQSTEATLKSQLEQMPQLAPYAQVLRDFYKEQLDWKTLEPEFTRLYLEVFTEGELREMTAFYQSPLGRKMLTKMPLLMARSNEVTGRRMQAAMPKLMERLEAASSGAGSRPPLR